jgi:hypothetical protein
MISPGFGRQIAGFKGSAGMKDDRIKGSQKLSNRFVVLGSFNGTIGLNSVSPIIKSGFDVPIK